MDESFHWWWKESQSGGGITSRQRPVVVLDVDLCEGSRWSKGEGRGNRSVDVKSDKLTGMGLLSERVP